MKKVFREILDDIKAFDNSAEGRGYTLRLDLASIILKAIQEKGWTQNQLAEAAGMKAPMLTRILHSASNCTFDTAGKILFALGLEGELIVKQKAAPAAKGSQDGKTKTCQSKVSTSFAGTFSADAETHWSKGEESKVQATVYADTASD